MNVKIGNPVRVVVVVFVGLMSMGQAQAQHAQSVHIHLAPVATNRVGNFVLDVLAHEPSPEVISAYPLPMVGDPGVPFRFEGDSIGIRFDLENRMDFGQSGLPQGFGSMGKTSPTRAQLIGRRPILRDGGSVNIVPLPAAAYAGLGLLLGLGGIRIARRRAGSSR